MNGERLWNGVCCALGVALVLSITGTLGGWTRGAVLERNADAERRAARLPLLRSVPPPPVSGVPSFAPSSPWGALAQLSPVPPTDPLPRPAAQRQRVRSARSANLPPVPSASAPYEGITAAVAEAGGADAEGIAEASRSGGW